MTETQLDAGAVGQTCRTLPGCKHGADQMTRNWARERRLLLSWVLGIGNGVFQAKHALGWGIPLLRREKNSCAKVSKCIHVLSKIRGLAIASFRVPASLLFDGTVSQAPSLWLSATSDVKSDGGCHACCHSPGNAIIPREITSVVQSASGGGRRAWLKRASLRRLQARQLQANL
jgi:hypothetical protein